MYRGINFDLPANIDLLTAIFYTRVREDRKNRRGSSPTKYKVPICQMDYLPQLHPATDIPYSYALTIAPNFIGRNVLVEHDDLKKAGQILFSALTENPEHTLPESLKEECTYEGKPIKFASIIGILGVKNKEKKHFDEFHIKSLKDLDCSIGYGYYFDIDDIDIKFLKNGGLDWNKTLVYATGFKERELSLCDHGRGACPGANVISQLSKNENIGVKFGMTTKLWKLYTERSQKLSKFNGIEKLKRGMLKTHGFFKTLKIKSVNILDDILQKNKNIIQKNINIILKKKMSTEEEKEKVDSMKIDKPEVVDTKSIDESGKEVETEDYEKYLKQLGITIQPDIFERIGKQVVKSRIEFTKEYKDVALKKFPKEKDNFIKAIKTLKKEDMLNKEVENDLKEMYTDPEKEPLSKIFKTLIDNFNEIAKKNTLSTEAKQPIKEKSSNNIKKNVETTFYSNLSKNNPIKKTLSKEKPELKFNVEPRSERDKTMFWKIFNKFKETKPII